MSLLLKAEAQRVERLEDAFQRRIVAAATFAFLTCAKTFLVTYQAYKDRDNLLDYDDLIRKTRTLLRNPDVLSQIGLEIDHLLLDEAQDIDPDQWEILAILLESLFTTPKPATGFVVGDEKQSIYRFKNVIPAHFRSMQERFRQIVSSHGGLWKEIHLTLCFRSTESILQFVDTVFADQSGLFTALEHIPVRSGGHVEILPLFESQKAPRPTTLEMKPADPELTACQQMTSHIATLIAEWLKDHALLTEHGRPIQASDILILVRNHGLDEIMAKALRHHHLPAAVDRLILTDQIAIKDLIAILEFVLLPEDDLTLAILLKSPLIAMDEETLFSLSYGRVGSLWDVLKTHQESSPIYSYLQGLSMKPTPYALFSYVLERPCPADPWSGRRAILTSLGEECLVYLDHFVSLCLEFEQKQEPSLQNFLLRIQSDKVILKQETSSPNAIRVMTVHSAKGLEAPIVFLLETGLKPFSFLTSDRLAWPDSLEELPLLIPNQAACIPDVCRRRCQESERQARQEELRLLYVALTRSADHLYIGGVHEPKSNHPECWYTMAQKGSITSHSFQKSSGASEPLLEPIALPSWARPLPPLEYPQGQATLEFDKNRLIRHLLAILPEIPHPRRRPVAQRILASHGHQDSCLLDHVFRILEEPSCVQLFEPGGSDNVPLIGCLNDQAVSAPIDRLVIKDNIWLALYKTGPAPPKKTSNPTKISSLYTAPSCTKSTLKKNVFA